MSRSIKRTKEEREQIFASEITRKLPKELQSKIMGYIPGYFHEYSGESSYWEYPSKKKEKARGMVFGLNIYEKLPDELRAEVMSYSNRYDQKFVKYPNYVDRMMKNGRVSLDNFLEIILLHRTVAVKHLVRFIENHDEYRLYFLWALNRNPSSKRESRAHFLRLLRSVEGETAPESHEDALLEIFVHAVQYSDHETLNLIRKIKFHDSCGLHGAIRKLKRLVSGEKLCYAFTVLWDCLRDQRDRVKVLLHYGPPIRFLEFLLEQDVKPVTIYNAGIDTVRGGDFVEFIETYLPEYINTDAVIDMIHGKSQLKYPSTMMKHFSDRLDSVLILKSILEKGDYHHIHDLLKYTDSYVAFSIMVEYGMTLDEICGNLYRLYRGYNNIPEYIIDLIEAPRERIKEKMKECERLSRR